ncbi:MAG: hypothetical protein Ct9H90mP25_6100 [Gammaproteobacteria bacterium]|nr:MAG: hypothetical protein Ct9H90mP25_6100 [Gammaproteobacteria bacterium]
MKKGHKSQVGHLYTSRGFWFGANTASAGTMAQRGSMAESGKPAAHAGQQPFNNLPTPMLQSGILEHYLMAEPGVQ